LRLRNHHAIPELGSIDPLRSSGAAVAQPAA
jgi:hypothetical protein